MIMRNFSAVCKKKLKEALLPYGYGNWKSIFYKLEQDIFVLVHMKGKFSYGKSIIETWVKPIPYCCGGISKEDLDLGGPMHDNLFRMLERIMPDKSA